MTQTNGITTYDVLFDEENRVSLITSDAQKAQNIALDDTNFGNTWHKGLDAESLANSVPMKVIAKTIDDQAWSRFAFYMKQRIARLREKEEAEAITPPPALFPVSHVDLPETIAAFRLEMIGNYRRNNPADLQSAVELIETTTASRHQRPVNRDNITDATWNRGLIEQRFDEELDTLQAERLEQGERFDRLYQDAAMERHSVPGGLSASETQLLAATDSIRQLDYVIEHHAGRSPGLNVA